MFPARTESPLFIPGTSDHGLGHLQPCSSGWGPVHASIRPPGISGPAPSPCPVGTGDQKPHSFSRKEPPRKIGRDRSAGRHAGFNGINTQESRVGSGGSIFRGLGLLPRWL